MANPLPKAITTRGWECDWPGDARFHLRHFRALPMEKKIKAVEEMCKLARALRPTRKAKPKRRPANRT